MATQKCWHEWCAAPMTRRVAGRQAQLKLKHADDTMRESTVTSLKTSGRDISNGTERPAACWLAAVLLAPRAATSRAATLPPI
eukprot:3376954-Prymnesium_polylepis.1